MNKLVMQLYNASPLLSAFIANARIASGGACDWMCAASDESWTDYLNESKKMKIEIDKEGNTILVTFTPDDASKPQTVQFQRDNIDMLIKILQTAAEAKTLRFALEL